jgi:hypothetical protein
MGVREAERYSCSAPFHGWFRDFELKRGYCIALHIFDVSTSTLLWQHHQYKCPFSCPMLKIKATRKRTFINMIICTSCVIP